jgi:hypothetical protein
VPMDGAVLKTSGAHATLWYLLERGAPKKSR